MRTGTLRKITLLPFLFFALAIVPCEAQRESQTTKKRTHHLAFQWIGLTIHPGGGTMPENYPLKLDPKATFVVNVGGVLAYDYYLSERWFVRGQASYYRDCAYLPSVFAHVGIRYTFLTLGKHSFNGGIGPTFIAREDWHRFAPRYKGRDLFGNRVYNGWQYCFVWYGGEVEYQYKMNDKWDFLWSVIPGYPTVITSKIGFRVKL